MNPYHQFHIELLKQSYNHLITYSLFNGDEVQHQDQQFLDNFLNLIDECNEFSADYITNGQQFCLQWIRAYPDLSPVLPRDLLWFFGGDCLHYMPDEEINQFQQLDELRFEAESNNQPFNYPVEREKFFKLAK